MHDHKNHWRQPTLLITLLCGALLLYFPREGRPFWEMLEVDDHTAFPVFLALALTLFLPGASWKAYERWLACIGNYPKLVSFLVFLVLGLLSPWIYQGKPLSTDEYLFWFQAHTFAQGHLFATYPTDWLHHLLISQELFVTDWRSGGLLSPYWPGFSLLLAPLAFIGLPWLGNPLVVALSIYALASIARELFESPAARGMVLLLSIASPCFFLNGVTFYATPAHLLFNATFTLLLLRPSRLRLILAGIVGSLALVLHNPLPHLLFALPWFAWLARSHPGGWRQLVPLGAGYLPLALIVGVGWAILRLNSNCPIACAAAADSAAVLSPVGTATAVATFGTSAFVLPNAEILMWRVAGTVKLWLSSVPGILFLAGLAPFRNGEPRLKVLAASALLTYAGYFFIPFDQGFGWGYRYFHSAWFVLPLLAAAVVTPWHESPDTTDHSSLVRVAIFSVALFLPFKAFIMLSYTSGHWNQLPPHQGTRNEIIFKNSFGNWGYFLIQNPPDLTGAPTVFLSRGHKRDAEFMERFFPGATQTGVNAYGTTYTVPDTTRPDTRLLDALRYERSQVKDGVQPSPSGKD